MARVPIHCGVRSWEDGGACSWSPRAKGWTSGAKAVKLQFMRERLIWICGSAAFLLFLAITAFILWAPTDPSVELLCPYRYNVLCTLETFQGLLGGILATIAAIITAFAIWLSAKHTAATSLLQFQLQGEQARIELLEVLAVETEALISGDLVKGSLAYLDEQIRHFSHLANRGDVQTGRARITVRSIPNENFVIFRNNSDKISKIPKNLAKRFSSFYYRFIDYKSLREGLNEGIYNNDPIPAKIETLKTGLADTKWLLEEGSSIVADLRNAKEEAVTCSRESRS